MNKRNARRIRRGIKAAQQVIALEHAGMPLPPTVIEDALERKAYLHTLKQEVYRIARRALRSAAQLRGED